MRPDAIDWSAKRDELTLAALPRQRMHRVVWRRIAFIIFAQALIAAIVLAALQGPWRQTQRFDAADELAALAAGQLTLHSADAQTVLDRLAAGPSVRFACVIDEQSRVVSRIARDNSQWESHQALLRNAMAADEPRMADSLRQAIVVQAPIPGGGRLIVGLDDQGARRAMLDGLIALGAGLLVAIVVLLPMTQRRIRRWTRGLAAVHGGIRRLATGGDLKPVSVGGEDEAAYLALAFNDMASRLLAGRHALEELNQDLERRVVQRTDELRQAAEKLDRLASSDMLTGLANRRALMSGMELMFKTVPPAQQDLFCLAVDLDGFKGVNDSLGHAVGDELLQLAGTIFRAACRRDDLVARLGGDEFVLILPLDSMASAEDVARRLLDEFGERCRARFEGTAAPRVPSMSIGIASRRDACAETPEQLLQAADTALYAAKEAGKSQYIVSQPRRDAA